MTSPTLWIAAGVILLLAGALLACSWRIRVLRQQRSLPIVRTSFHQQREWLEAKFVGLASSSGKPRGLRWSNCEFDDPVTFARDRSSHALAAFVGVTISFEAIEGGDMEDVEAVGNLRAATAVFHLRGAKWHTEGRVIMNLEPVEAIERFHQTLEIVENC